MSSTKCHACGVINFANSETCRRCGTELPPIDTVLGPQSTVTGAHASAATIDDGRGFGSWVLWILGVTATILISCYVSLIASSDGLSVEERLAVTSAIDELERAGKRCKASGSRRTSWDGRQPATATRACGRTHASGPPAACRCSSAAGRMGSRTVLSELFDR
jgi:hypothetical protein